MAKQITREQFMAFFRSDEGYSQLSVDDCVELFSQSLKGSDDFTVELLEKVASDYNLSISVDIER